MRNPNGYGSVVKLVGNRRKPFIARVTIGYTDKGNPRYKILGSFSTREEGLLELAEYNKLKFLEFDNRISFKEVADRYFKSCSIAESTLRAYKAMFKYLEPIYSMPIFKIKLINYQSIIDNMELKYSAKNTLKAVITNIENFALQYDIVPKGYAQYINVGKPNDTKEKEIFTSEEVAKLWELQGDIYIDTALILLYTGFRVQELLILKNEDIDLTNNFFKGGLKTTAGKNRLVPIHSKIKDIVQHYYDKQMRYFLSTANGKINYGSLRNHWNNTFKENGISLHTPHEARHTFRTKMDEVGANLVATNLIMGHQSREIGHRIYTHKTKEQLQEAIELLCY